MAFFESLQWKNLDECFSFPFLKFIMHWDVQQSFSIKLAKEKVEGNSISHHPWSIFVKYHSKRLIINAWYISPWTFFDSTFPKVRIREINSGSKFTEIKELLYFPKLNAALILAFRNIFCLISVLQCRVICYSPKFTDRIYLPN